MRGYPTGNEAQRKEKATNKGSEMWGGGPRNPSASGQTLNDPGRKVTSRKKYQKNQLRKEILLALIKEPYKNPERKPKEINKGIRGEKASRERFSKSSGEEKRHPGESLKIHDQAKKSSNKKGHQ